MGDTSHMPHRTKKASKRSIKLAPIVWLDRRATTLRAVEAKLACTSPCVGLPVGSHVLDGEITI